MRALGIFALLFGCGGAPQGSDLSATPPDYAIAQAIDGGVACGTTQCHAELSQICCIEPGYEYCGSAEACSAGIALYCDGPADCAGGVCCQTAASTVSCAKGCTGALVCQVDTDCPASRPHCCGTLAASAHRTCSSSC